MSEMCKLCKAEMLRSEEERAQEVCGLCLAVETKILRERHGMVEGCPTCDEHEPGDFFPRHEAMPTCRSGKRPHCTCDTCF